MLVCSFIAYVRACACVPVLACIRACAFAFMICTSTVISIGKLSAEAPSLCFGSRYIRVPYKCYQRLNIYHELHKNSLWSVFPRHRKVATLTCAPPKGGNFGFGLFVFEICVAPSGAGAAHFACSRH